MQYYISVILCCYNSEKYIQETLQSIKNQTYNKIYFFHLNYFPIKLPTFGTPISVNGIIFIKKDRLLLGSKFPSL